MSKAEKTGEKQVQMMEESQDDQHVTQEEIQVACKVLDYFSRHEEEYKRPEQRKLRGSLQPLFLMQRESMFGGSGLSATDYHEAKRQKERRKQEKNRIKQENERLLRLTTLRAGRIRRLEELKNGTTDDVLLVADGVAEDGVNLTTLHSDPNQKCLENGERKPEEEAPLKYGMNSFRSCYICKRRYQSIHHFYDSLCPSCAKLNWKKRMQVCDMKNKICLVTGGRVKIGFQCCLKLLRCGATVIATSRFPCDTAKRFAAQSDYKSWSTRIHIFGLDLRDLPYVESFCDMLIQRYSHLDVVINNACQTIRRPRAYYSHLIEDEEKMMHSVNEICDMQASDDLKPSEAALASMLEGDLRFRQQYSRAALRNNYTFSSSVDSSQDDPDGVVIAKDEHPRLSSSQLSQVPITTEDLVDPTESARLFPKDARDINNQQIDLRRKHTWLLRMHEVSTPEVAEVFAINSISPFVMIARLKPMLAKESVRSSEMCKTKGKHETAFIPSLAEYILRDESREKMDMKPNKTKPDGRQSIPYCKGAVSGSVHHEECSFVVNVSSMEGKFYRRKMEAHPHTNMAKAALNMMTRTAADDYCKSNIFMTAVDTGWINDENPLDKAAAIAENHNFATPLDEVDAAARILDPVLYPLRKGMEHENGECSPFYGCFLKDYFLSEW